MGYDREGRVCPRPYCWAAGNPQPLAAFRGKTGRETKWCSRCRAQHAAQERKYRASDHIARAARRLSTHAFDALRIRRLRSQLKLERAARVTLAREVERLQMRLAAADKTRQQLRVEQANRVALARKVERLTATLGVHHG